MEKNELIELRKNDIRKPNDIVRETAFKLSAQEFDLLNYIIMKADIKPDEDLKPVTFSIREYCALANIDLDGNYGHIRASLKALRDKSVWTRYRNEKGEIKERTVSWIKDPEITLKSGIVTVEFNDFWQETKKLNRIAREYTLTRLQEMLPMKSVYGKRLYELLTSYHMGYSGKWEPISFTVDELKKLLLSENEEKKGKPKKELYKDFSNFRKKVIVPAMNDLDLYGRIDVKVDYRREGRSVKYIDFEVKAKEGDLATNSVAFEEMYFKEKKPGK